MNIFYNYLNFNMKKTLHATLIFALATFLMTPAQANVIITGVYDCTLTGGTPKGVELYVTADVADLSMYGIGSANNGQGTDGEEFTFPAGAYTAGVYISCGCLHGGFVHLCGNGFDAVYDVFWF